MSEQKYDHELMNRFETFINKEEERRKMSKIKDKDDVTMFLRAEDKRKDVRIVPEDFINHGAYSAWKRGAILEIMREYQRETGSIITRDHAEVILERRQEASRYEE